jgi:hypothetical protein
MKIGLGRGLEGDGSIGVAFIARSFCRSLAVGFLASLTALAAAPATASAQPAPAVSHLRGPALSPRLSDLPPVPRTPPTQIPKVIPAPRRLPPRSVGPGGAGSGETIRQTQPGPGLSIQPKTGFDGIGENGSLPPDPNIAVGQNYIVQVVNTEIAVFDKSTGAMLPGYPKTLSSLWSGAGAPCNKSNAGDPIVQYDNLAPDGLGGGGTGRWIITELGSLNAPYSECFAISETSDPTGSYYLYYQKFGNYLNDYPKFGVWPTASNSVYLASYNLFYLGLFPAGSQLAAYDRQAMLNGAASPGFFYYTISNDGNFLPADLDGSTPPNDKTPGYFLNFETLSSLRLYQLSPNFLTGKSTLSYVDIGVPSFSEACGGGSCIPQPGTSEQLDSLGDRLMYRLAYRVLGDGSAAMVVNHSIAAGNGVGVRWYELAQPSGSSFSVAQRGTFAPDSAARWMGSAAMDSAGDIMLGYSKSSSLVYPSIAFTGRTPDMTADTMGSETILVPGAGSQTGYTRWGDYTALRIDPGDDSTFWYTNEYYKTTSNYVWSTYIGSFTIAGGSPPPGTVDFSLSLSSTSLTVKRGSSNSLTVTVTATSGSPLVSLSASGLPKATSASFNPDPVTATNDSTLTISAGRHGPKGSWTVTVTGSDASGSQSATFALTVQ